MGHSVHFNTAVTSQEIFAKLRIWTKKRARSISYNHIKMMQSMVYLISLFTLILIKWHVTSPEISGLVTSPVMTWYWGNLNKIWYWGILPYLAPIIQLQNKKEIWVNWFFIINIAFWACDQKTEIMLVLIPSERIKKKTSYILIKQIKVNVWCCNLNISRTFLGCLEPIRVFLGLWHFRSTLWFLTVNA